MSRHRDNLDFFSFQCFPFRTHLNALSQVSTRFKEGPHERYNPPDHHYRSHHHNVRTIESRQLPPVAKDEKVKLSTRTASRRH